MKKFSKKLLLMPFIALLLFTSCQEETIDISDPTEDEVITSDSELTSLLALVSKTVSDTEDEESIEGIDFSYPITLAVYSTDFQFIETVEIENDTQLYELIQGVITKDYIATLSYPITMVAADGTQIEVNSNDELQSTITEYADNEATDVIDNVDEINEVLNSGEWTVTSFYQDQNDYLSDIEMNTFVFAETGEIYVTSTSDESYTGTWRTYEDNGLFIEFDFDGFFNDELNNHWEIVEIDADRIELVDNNSSPVRVLVFEKNQ
jgi:hypothetical protein